ncbi:MAG: amidohydrolase family protein [Saprospiraceae bacterium]|uniref:Amidohydrolase family protein n=1 Tax=Candidatus Defluviibacterium haderslevense TaxID=2981993 RepID=A0A9D7S892_9BACT|nr:amidohydrolase family protein [Candidatus Defluviibacterium haderslevense]
MAVEAGADILVHSIDDKILDEPMLRLLKTKNIVYIPTLQVYDNYLRIRTQNFSFTSHDFNYANPFMLGSTMDLQHINSAISGIDYKYFQSILKLPNSTDSIQAKNLSLVMQAGINVVAGTDAGNIGTHHGSSFLKELEMMKSAGLNELDILRSCTINAAKGFGKENEWGSIENNKIADILLLDKNPLIDLSTLNNIPTVIHRGVVINTKELLLLSPEILVQQQLNAYNARDLEAFLTSYSDSVELYNFPNTLIAKGKEQMKKGYVDMFKNTPDLHCEIVEHIVLGNTIIDHERVSGFGNNKIEAVAIYEIEKGKIVRVYFKN